jgi:acyl carrier protein
MASESTVAIQIRTALAQHLKRDVDKVRPEHRLREDLGLDSLAMIELLFKIEEHFDLEIPNEDLSRITTVADVTAYVEEKLGASTPTGTAPVKPVPAAAAAIAPVSPAEPGRSEPARTPAKVTSIKVAAKRKAAAGSPKTADKKKGPRRA